MSYTPRYDKGDWLALCDVCGRKFKSSTLKKRWDGLMTCDQDWEIRQPQDFVRGQADTQIAPWLRTEPSDSFIPFTFERILSAIVGKPTVTIRRKFISFTATKEELNAAAINVKTLG